jgi:large subunit ribosomal protein L6e
MGKKKNKKPIEKKKEEKKMIIKEFGKKKEKREIKRPRETRFYPTEDIPKPIPSRKNHHHPTKLRSSITPGTILIILSGRFRGKRVVFLKQLKSGLLLVTGPYKINGVPLRRVNQAYVIATSTKIDISNIKLDEFHDDYFKKPTPEKKKKTEEQFFVEEKEKVQIDKKRVDDQKKVDSPLLEIIKKTPKLYEYLNAKFSLRSKQYPHELIF